MGHFGEKMAVVYFEEVNVLRRLPVPDQREMEHSYG
jgi:hypothetical protein